MKVLTHRVAYRYGETFRLKPIADVHLGSTACDERAFKSYLADSDENTLFVGIGDLLDCIIVDDVRRYRKSGDVSIGDEVIDEQVDKAIAYLTPYKDRIISLGQGNHEDTIVKHCGTSPVKRVCKALGVPFGGYSGLIRLLFRTESGKGRKVIVRYHHGWGGGSRTRGADLTKFSKDVSFWDADIYLYGHTHQRQTDAMDRLGLVGEKLVAKPKIICICGTFLRTYTKGSNPTYSEVKGYPPVSVGGVEILIKPSREWVKLKAYLN